MSGVVAEKVAVAVAHSSTKTVRSFWRLAAGVVDFITARAILGKFERRVARTLVALAVPVVLMEMVGWLAPAVLMVVLGEAEFSPRVGQMATPILPAIKTLEGQHLQSEAMVVGAPVEAVPPVAVGATPVEGGGGGSFISAIQYGGGGGGSYSLGGTIYGGSGNAAGGTILSGYQSGIGAGGPTNIVGSNGLVVVSF